MNRKLTYISLWLACIVGALCVLPYLYQLHQIPSPSLVLVASVTAQAAVFYGLLVWLCSFIVPKTDLDPFNIEKTNVPYAFVMGIVIAGVLLILDSTLFANSFASHTPSPSPWAGTLASVYGGINEEVMLRLLMLTLNYYVLGKMITTNGTNRIYLLWIANSVAALLFAAGHLPLAFQITTPSTLDITRILVLNGLASLTFGWLYFSRSLWSAMVAHFTADVVIHTLWMIH